MSRLGWLRPPFDCKRGIFLIPFILSSNQIILAVDSCTTDEDAYPLTFQVFLQNTDGSYEAKTAAEASDRIAILGPPALLTNNDIPYNTFQVKVRFGG